MRARARPSPNYIMHIEAPVLTDVEHASRRARPRKIAPALCLRPRHARTGEELADQPRGAAALPRASLPTSS